MLVDERYEEYVRLLRQLHQLWIEEQGESPQADALRDQMDVSWEKLTPEQREIIGGLASDLNCIRRGPVPSGKSEEEVKREDEPALRLALKSKDWHATLTHLRRCAPYRRAEEVAYLRGRAWSELGDHETALLFFERAKELRPQNGNFAFVTLECLNRVDPERALQHCGEVLSDDTRRFPAEVVKAADIRFQATRALPEEQRREAMKELATVLERTLDRMRLIGEHVENPLLFSIASVLAAFCHESQGDVDAARAILDQALELSPDDRDLLVARGVLLYDTQSNQAVEDFRRAIRLGSTEVWPYFLCAYHLLLERRFDKCLRFCGGAMRLAASDTVRANMLEWIAICQWQLGFPAEVVRASFTAARELAPKNERINRNTILFERSVGHEAAEDVTWEQEEESAIRAIREAEFPPALTGGV
jgi:tetratricopeptide (TPR) repeat protein